LIREKKEIRIPADNKIETQKSRNQQFFQIRNTGNAGVDKKNSFEESYYRKNKK
jgi:hypothetical protein